MFSRHLLWKDYRQALPGLVGCWAILAVLIAIGYVRHLTENPGSGAYAESLLFALVAPTLAAMAISGLLIGQERQTGSWNWSSSLPIEWQRALVSKTVVWLVASIVMLATLLVMYGCLWQLCIWQGLTPRMTEYWASPYTLVMTVALVPIEVYVCFSLAALVLNETLPAMVIAGVLVSIAHFVLTDVAPRVLLRLPTNTELTLLNAGVLGIGLAVLTMIVGGGFLSARAFRWRWGSGQNSVAAWRRASSDGATVAQPAIWLSYSLVTRQPSQMGMLLWHGATSSLALRSLTFVAALLMMTRTVPGFAGDAILVVLFGASGLLGLSVFAADQPRNRFRFLADRGVAWWKLLVSHALVPFCMLVVLSIVPVFSLGTLPTSLLGSMFLISLAYMIFLAGICCSLCVSSTIVSTGLLVTVVLLTALFYGFNEFLWQNLALFAPVPIWRIVAAVVGLPLATFFIVRHWLLRDRVPTLKYLAAVLSCLVLLPIFLELTTNFLLVPNRPWQGMPASQVKFDSPHSAIELGRVVDELPTAIKIDPDWASNSIQDVWRARIASQELQQGGRTITADKRKALIAELTSISSRIDKQLVEGPRSLSPMHVQLIYGTAFWGFAATYRHFDRDLAVAAWRANAKLSSLIDFDVLDNIELLRARIHSNLSRRQLTNDDWYWLAEAANLNDLISEPIETERLEKLLRMSATIDYRMLDGQPANTVPASSWPRTFDSLYAYSVTPANWASISRPPWAWQLIENVPTLRWNYQRQASTALANQIAMLRQIPAILDHAPDLTSQSLSQASLLAQMQFDEVLLKRLIDRFSPSTMPPKESSSESSSETSNESPNEATDAAATPASATGITEEQPAARPADASPESAE